MSFLSKPASKIVIAVIVIIIGFILLLRGCLAKYDERFAHTHPLYFEKDGKGVVFTIVEHQRATSYSQKGNMVNKSVSTSYYIQTNDATTAELIKEEKVKSRSNVKYHPVEMLGPSANNAWFFMGELMAFDAFTLEKKADTKILETKNPSLAGKFPKERQYYLYNRDNRHIYFTAIDGSKWELNTETLLAAVTDYSGENSPLKQRIAELEKADKRNHVTEDSLYQQNFAKPSQQYAAKEINYDEYNRITKKYYDGRKILEDERDSIAIIKRKLQTQEDSERDIERTIENLQGNNSFTSTKTNQDTINGKWYGLYSPSEIEKLYDRVRYQSENDETARRQFYTGTYSLSKNEAWMIDKESITKSSSSDFLHAGFLLDKNTGMPIHLDKPGSFIVIHREQIGHDAKILISRTSIDGKALWNFNSQLSQWSDWICNGKQLILFGTDNKALSSGECNVLWCIDLTTGKASRYDYFSNKSIKVE